MTEILSGYIRNAGLALPQGCLPKACVFSPGVFGDDGAIYAMFYTVIALWLRVPSSYWVDVFRKGFFVWLGACEERIADGCATSAQPHQHRKELLKSSIHS